MWVKASVTVTGIALLVVSAVPQAREGQYLIERMSGQWEVREKGKDRQLTGKYDVITTASQIRCVQAPCVLDYSTDTAAKPVFAKSPALGAWVQVPVPTEPPVARSAADLQRLIAGAGVRGGATKDTTTCGGTLPLLAPRCGELIDPDSFDVRWTPRSADGTSLYTLTAGPTDATDRRRWNTNADAGALQSKAIQEYLTSLQLPDREVSITLRLMRTTSYDAFRQVRLPSLADQAEHRRVLRTFDRLPELPRTLSYLEQYLKVGMYSKAADMSRALLDASPSSIELQRYALIGFCGSDFIEDAARLRSSLRNAGITGICESSGDRK